MIRKTRPDLRRALAGRLPLTAAVVAMALISASPTAASAQFAGPQFLLPGDGGPSSMAFNPVRRQYVNVVDGRFNTSGALLSGTGVAHARFSTSDTIGSRASDVAHDPRNDRYLIPYREGPLSADLFAADGTRLAGGIVLSPDAGPFPGADALPYDPAVAYNVRAREWLVVYTVDSDDGGSVVRAARLDAGGTVLATDILAADRGRRNDSPDLAYRPATGDYVLAWSVVDAAGASDVYAQRLRTSGTPGGPAWRLSHGRNEAGRRAATAPAVTVNPASNEAFVAWSDGFEIHGCRVTGILGWPDRCLQLSSTGAAGDLDAHALAPAVAYSRPGDEYLVVWSAVDPTLPGSPALSPQIVGQHLTRSARERGPDDFVISADTYVSPDAPPPIESGSFELPSLAADAFTRRYLVSYRASISPGPGEYLQFGRLLDTVGPAGE
jgi:hypothetical protein